MTERGSDPRPTRVGAMPARQMLLAAASFAAAGIALALIPGRFLTWGRAEALLFFAFRPWLLAALALFAAPAPWRRRLLLYVFALGLAALSESLFLVALGGRPWAEAARGLAAGATILVVFDFFIQLGRRFAGPRGRWVAAGLIILVLTISGMPRAYERLLLGPQAQPAAVRPLLLLMSGLPLVWGEGGAFDPASRPAESYLALRKEFDVRPIDHLDPATLAGARLMLLAQPRTLAPAELVALDSWVRRGGRLLILADPALSWPSRLPIGDPRRPPRTSRLGPLLDHWGVDLEHGPVNTRVDHLEGDRMPRRLRLENPGRFRIRTGPCRAGTRDYVAFCRVGQGRALLVADADLLHDSLWHGPGPHGGKRQGRISDNVIIVADWLDRLAGIERTRAARPVRWRAAGSEPGRALLLGLLPILLALLIAGSAWSSRAIHRLIHIRGTRTKQE